MDASTNSKIRQLCSQGEKLHNLGDYDRAVSKFYEALTLLPKNEHSRIASYLYVSIGEAYWCMQDFENAGESFCEAYECPGMNENAQITMRIGQCLAECEDPENARDYLRHAVRLGGEDMLLAEDHKYYELLHPGAKKNAAAKQPVSSVQPKAEPAENLAAQAAESGFASFDGYRQFGGENAGATDAAVPAAPAPELKKPEAPAVIEVPTVPEAPAAPAPAAAAEKPRENRFTAAAAALADDIRSDIEPEAQAPVGDMFNPKPHGCVTSQLEAAAQSEAAPQTPAAAAPAEKPAAAESDKKQGFFQRFFKKK